MNFTFSNIINICHGFINPKYSSLKSTFSKIKTVPLALNIAKDGATKVVCFKPGRELSPTQPLLHSRQQGGEENWKGKTVKTCRLR